MTAERTVALLGLPRTGKSTFLGTLWLLVQDPSVAGIWEEDVSGDRSYVESLAQLVADGQEIERTNIESEQGLSLELGFADAGIVRMDIPDLSGEAVREVVEGRVWGRPLVDTLARSDSLMLFVNPDNVDFPMPANLAASASTKLQGEHEEQDFSPEKACTAAKLVELLENVVDRVWRKWPIPVAVVVSAWDRVDKDKTPSAWLQERLQGASAYLESNPDLTTFSVFGVSAQGGRLPEERAQLLDKGDVSKRVFAVAADGAPAELYDPLRWLVRDQ